MRETALELARKAADVFAARGIDQGARLDAELLLAHVLGVSRLQLYLQHDRPVADDELARFRVLVRRRLKREPVQYIVGTAHFRELELAVDPRVLIPRPETEELVGHVLDWAWARVGGRPGKRAQAVPLAWTRGGADERAESTAVLRDAGSVADGGTAGRPAGEPPPPPLEKAGSLTALDLGTGSGAIALSLLKEGPFARVVATDPSADALTVARANAERLGLADRVELRLGPLWAAVAPDERFDVVASNPPYVADSERAALSPEVADWEPAGALFAGEAGFDVLEPLVRGAGGRLQAGGLLALEIGAAQANGIRERLAAAGGFADVRVLRDLAGRDRVVLAVANSLAREWKRGEHA